MPSYSPELIQIMRAALDEVMTKNSCGAGNAGNQSPYGRVHFEDGRRGPDQLRWVVGRRVGANSDNSLDADVRNEDKRVSEGWRALQQKRPLGG